MLNNIRKFFVRIFIATLASCVLFSYTTIAIAWGPDGHTAIGIMAINQLQPDARRELTNILKLLDEQAILEACNWPDAVRETEEWDWSAPHHYINIPRGDFVYLESRDCPDQLCATQAIKRYAAELGNREASKVQRKQAFAWLCHLVGDLHQPLHAGFADDRGGNDFDVIFQDAQMNLHSFWDFELINQNAGSWQRLASLLSSSLVVPANSDWSPEMVNEWTNESHSLAQLRVYPTKMKIDESYERQSWELVQQRIISATSHLALIINSVLQGGD